MLALKSVYLSIVNDGGMKAAKKKIVPIDDKVNFKQLY